MHDSLELQIARSSIGEFAVHVVHDHREVAACQKCQELLAEGIGSLRWLESAEQSLREADARQIVPFTPAVQNALEHLYVEWLEASQKTEQLLSQLSEGYSPDNLTEFRGCCERARGWIEANEWRKTARASQENRLASEPW